MKAGLIAKLFSQGVLNKRATDGIFVLYIHTVSNQLVDKLTDRKLSNNNFDDQLTNTLNQATMTNII